MTGGRLAVLVGCLLIAFISLIALANGRGEWFGFASIAIQIGATGGLAPERRGEVAELGLKALLAGSMVNPANAAIAAVVAA